VDTGLRARRRCRRACLPKVYPGGFHKPNRSLRRVNISLYARCDWLTEPLHREFDICRLQMPPAFNLGLVSILRVPFEVFRSQFPSRGALLCELLSDERVFGAWLALLHPMGRWECVTKCGLHRQEYPNAIKGALLPWFARMPLIDLMIIGTLNHRVPGSSPGGPTKISHG
jgi:hypothetical protein